MVANALGCLPRTTQVGSRFPCLGDAMRVVNRSEWPQRIEASKCYPLRQFVPVIHNQNPENSCAANAATLAGVEIIRAVMRLPFVHMAPSSLYRHVNHGRDRGSGIDANLDALKEYGVLPVSVWGGETGWQKKPPEGWEVKAAQFRVTEWFDVSTFEEFITALLFAMPICYGVDWEGGGHAICAVDPLIGGKCGAVFANSWGSKWGDKGFGTMHEAQITAGIKKYGAWAARQVILSQGV